MKVRIEIEVGDKFIAEELIVPDETFVFSKWPNGLMANMKQEIWNRMDNARKKAINEFFAAHKAKLVKGEWS